MGAKKGAGRSVDLRFRRLSTSKYRFTRCDNWLRRPPIKLRVRKLHMRLKPVTRSAKRMDEELHLRYRRQVKVTFRYTKLQLNLIAESVTVQGKEIPFIIKRSKHRNRPKLDRSKKPYLDDSSIDDHMHHHDRAGRHSRVGNSNKPYLDDSSSDEVTRPMVPSYRAQQLAMEYFERVKSPYTFPDIPTPPLTQLPESYELF